VRPFGIGQGLRLCGKWRDRERRGTRQQQVSTR